MKLLMLSIDFVGVIFEVIITHLMFLYLTQERRISKARVYVFSAAIIVVMSMATCIESDVYVLPALIFLSSFAISVMYRSKWGIRLFLSILLLIFFTLTEMAVGALLVFFAHVDIADIQTNTSLYMVGLFASKLLIFLLVKVVGFKKLQIYRHMRKTTFMGLLITPVSSAFAMYVMGTHMQNYQSSGSVVVLLCASTFMIISNVFVFYLYEKQLQSEFEGMKLAFAEKQIEVQASYYKDTSERQKLIQKLSHDMKNSLAGVLGLLEHNDLDAAIEQIRKLSGAVIENTVVNSGYPAIDALFTSKYQAAQERRIQMEAHIALPPEIKMDVLDLCILLGNALDNALEASEKIADESKRYIQLKMSAYEKYLSIQVENATADAESDHHYRTTKPDRYSHGFGLDSIRTIVARYDGSVDIQHKNKLFSVTALAKYG